MAGSTYFQQGELSLLRGTAFAVPPGSPATLYMSLHNGAPGLTGANELASGGGYTARIPLQMATAFGSPTTGTGGQQIANAGIVNTPVALGGGYGPFDHWGLWDSATIGAGNFWWPGPALTSAVTVAAGTFYQWLVGQLVLTIGGAASTYFANGLLNLLRGTTFSPAPGTLYIGEHTASPGAAGANNECSGNGYARIAVTLTSAFGSLASGGGGQQITESAAIAGSAATASYSYDWWTLWDALTGGNCWLVANGALPSTVTLVTGQAGQWTAPELVIQAV